MFKSYVLQYVRGFERFKLQTAISILGLATAFTAFILIALFVSFELSYENWLPNIDRVYRVETTYNFPGRDSSLTVRSPRLAGPTMESYFPEIEATARIFNNFNRMSVEDNAFDELIVYASMTWISTR